MSTPDPRLAAALERLHGNLAELATCDPSLLVELGEITPAQADTLTAMYERRTRCVLAALGNAATAGLNAGIGFDPDASDAWPVAYIELPDLGRVSWHLPAYEAGGDRESVTDKYVRVAAWLAAPWTSTGGAGQT